MNMNVNVNIDKDMDMDTDRDTGTDIVINMNMNITESDFECLWSLYRLRVYGENLLVSSLQSFISRSKFVDSSLLI